MTRRSARVLLWTARILSILSMLFFVLEAIAPDPYREDRPLRLDEIVGLAFFPVGVSLGMLVAWRWQRFGGLITAGSLVAFYVSMLVFRGGIPGGPWFFLFSLPGLMFLWLSFIDQERS